MDVPPSLRAWFAVHALVDVLAAAPLLLAPEFTLHLLGWGAIDPVATRLVGAALLAIGWQSWRVRRAGVDAYRALLGLKIIWSLTAGATLLVEIARGAPPAAWAFLSAFIGFAGIWVHHAVRLRQLERAPADDPDDEPEGDHLADDEAALS
jgi:hypothetical protein